MTITIKDRSMTGYSAIAMIDASPQGVKDV